MGLCQFFDDDDVGSWTADLMSRLYGREITVEELPAVFAAETRSRPARRLLADDEPLPRKRTRARVRLNDRSSVVVMPVNKKKRRVRLHDAAIIEFGPTRQQQLTEAFAKIGGAK